MMAGSMQVLPFEELDDESTDVARVYSLEEQFTDETSADRMVTELNDLVQTCCDDAVMNFA